MKSLRSWGKLGGNAQLGRQRIQDDLSMAHHLRGLELSSNRVANELAANHVTLTQVEVVRPGLRLSTDFQR